MIRLFIIITFFLLTISTRAQYYSSLIMYSPTYENDVESVNTSISIEEKSNLITLYNATYEGDVTNLRIDSIQTKYWTFETGEVKTFFCTDLDEEHVRIFVLDLIERKNTIKVIYKWDDISIEEYSFLVK